jgi:hypothetical protein
MNGLRITLAAGVAAALLCMSPSAHADEERGLSAGVRLGYAFPLGNTSSNVNFVDTVGGANPFWFDLGWRFNRQLYVGAFYQYSFIYVPQHSCGYSIGGSPLSCNGSDNQFGIDAAFHILPQNLVDPWVALGVGYEFTGVTHENLAGSESTDLFEGWVIHVQAGADLRFLKRVPFGPYIGLGVGQFNWDTRKDQNGYAPPGLAGHPQLDTAAHEWLTLGVRGQFNL